MPSPRQRACRFTPPADLVQVFCGKQSRTDKLFTMNEKLTVPRLYSFGASNVFSRVEGSLQPPLIMRSRAHCFRCRFRLPYAKTSQSPLQIHALEPGPGMSTGRALERVSTVWSRSRN